MRTEPTHSLLLVKHGDPNMRFCEKRLVVMVSRISFLGQYIGGIQVLLRRHIQLLLLLLLSMPEHILLSAQMQSLIVHLLAVQLTTLTGAP